MDIKKLLELKGKKTVPPGAVKEIRMISYNEEDPPNIIGSYGYRIQKYPADIDLMSEVNSYKIHGKWKPATSKDKLTKSFSDKIKNIVREVTETNSHYLLDFKSGIDERFLIKIGFAYDGVFYQTMEIDDVKPLLNKGLLTDEEFNKLVEILNEKDEFTSYVPGKGRLIGRSIETYEKLTKFFRQLYILRWNEEEIIKGYKKLRGGKKITFEESIEQGYLVKMDIAAPVNGIFMEISNIYTLSYMDDDERIIVSPVPSVDDIPFDIEKLYFSDDFFSPFKVCKRIYSYSRLKYLEEPNSLYAEAIKRTAPFISGDLAILYQVKSEIDTIISLISKFKNPSPVKIITQILGFKNRLSVSNILSSSQVSLLSNIINSASEDDNDESMIDKLYQINRFLGTIINDRSIRFLQQNNYNPIPDLFLPTEESAERLNKIGKPINPLTTKQFRETYDWRKVRMPKNNIGGVVLGASYTETDRENLRDIIMSRQSKVLGGYVI